MRRSLAACAAVLLWIAPLAARAQDPSEDQEVRDERARILFQAGRVHFEAGQYERALPEFEEAYELSGRTALLYNIGVARERLGQLEGALEALDEFLASNAESREIDRPQLERRVEALRERVEARARGADEAPSASIPVGPVVVFSVAGAGLIAGVVLGGMTVAEDGQLTGGCAVRPSGCSDADLSDVRALRVAADVSFGIALAAAVGGLVWWLVEGTSAREQPSVAVLPWLDPSGGLGVIAAGGF